MIVATYKLGACTAYIDDSCIKSEEEQKQIIRRMTQKAQKHLTEKEMRRREKELQNMHTQEENNN